MKPIVKRSELNLSQFYGRNPRLVAGLVLLSGLLFCVIFADFLAPYDPSEQNRAHYQAPPARLHIIDRTGMLRPRPFAHPIQKSGRTGVWYEEDPATELPVKFFVTGYSYKLLGLVPSSIHLFGTISSQRIFIWGSDALGRDLFSRVVHGTRFSLAIVLVSLLISIPVALIIGCLSGYYGGVIDFACMRLIEIFMALPAIYLIIALRSTLPLETPPEKVFLAMTLMISIFGWAGLARIVRGTSMTICRQDFVTAARSLGATDARIIIRHVMPHLIGVVLTQAALSAPGFILAEVSLSYLGLGVSEPLPSWGSMLAAAGGVTQLGTFWWNLAPGLAIFFCCLTFTLIAEGLQEMLDPRIQSLDSLRRF